jgi:tight adherence protein B
MMFAILVLVFITSLLLFFYILKTIFLSEGRVEKRMKRYFALPDPKIKRKQFNLFSQLQLTKNRIRKNVLSKDRNNKIEVMISRAGLPLKPEEYVLFQWICTALVGGLMYIILDNLIILIVGAGIGYNIPKWFLQQKQRERLVRFNNGLPDMISTIIGSLRAGFSFSQALKSVAEESDSPIKEEMETVLKEMQYGSSIEEALNSLKERMPSEDLELMIQAIIIQRQVGGNLATVLDKIVETIRARTKIQGMIKTLTAQGKLSGIVIALLPVILGVFLYIMDPEYVEAFIKHPIGIGMLVAGGISGVIGFILIRKVTTIEV